LVAAAKILVEATKNSLVVPNFGSVTKPFFFRVRRKVSHIVQSGSGNNAKLGCIFIVQFSFTV